MTSSILPRTIYHIVRHTLWPIKGHSLHAKIEGTMKTLVFYILNGIRFNTHDFFIRPLAASDIDLFGRKFYAPWIMWQIKLRSSINYQASARNHVVFLPEVDMSQAIYPEPVKDPFVKTMLPSRSSQHHLKPFMCPIPQLLLLVPLSVSLGCCIVLTLMQLQESTSKALEACSCPK